MLLLRASFKATVPLSCPSTPLAGTDRPCGHRHTYQLLPLSHNLPPLPQLSSMAAPPKQLTFKEVDAAFCTPGSYFEIEEVTIDGRPQRVWKNVRTPLPLIIIYFY